VALPSCLVFAHIRPSLQEAAAGPQSSDGLLAPGSRPQVSGSQLAEDMAGAALTTLGALCRCGSLAARLASTRGLPGALLGTLRAGRPALLSAAAGEWSMPGSSDALCASLPRELHCPLPNSSAPALLCLNDGLVSTTSLLHCYLCPNPAVWADTPCCGVQRWWRASRAIKRLQV
jgi:hypothetical protein